MSDNKILSGLSLKPYQQQQLVELLNRFMVDNTDGIGTNNSKSSSHLSSPNPLSSNIQFDTNHATSTNNHITSSYLTTVNSSSFNTNTLTTTTTTTTTATTTTTMTKQFSSVLSNSVMNNSLMNDKYYSLGRPCPRKPYLSTANFSKSNNDSRCQNFLQKNSLSNGGTLKCTSRRSRTEMHYPKNHFGFTRDNHINSLYEISKTFNKCDEIKPSTTYESDFVLMKQPIIASSTLIPSTICGTLPPTIGTSSQNFSTSTLTLNYPHKNYNSSNIDTINISSGSSTLKPIKRTFSSLTTTPVDSNSFLNANHHHNHHDYNQQQQQGEFAFRNHAQELCVNNLQYNNNHHHLHQPDTSIQKRLSNDLENKILRPQFPRLVEQPVRRNYQSTSETSTPISTPTRSSIYDQSTSSLCKRNPNEITKYSTMSNHFTSKHLSTNSTNNIGMTSKRSNTKPLHSDMDLDDLLKELETFEQSLISVHKRPNVRASLHQQQSQIKPEYNYYQPTTPQYKSHGNHQLLKKDEQYRQEDKLLQSRYQSQQQSPLEQFRLNQHHHLLSNNQQSQQPQQPQHQQQQLESQTSLQRFKQQQKQHEQQQSSELMLPPQTEEQRRKFRDNSFKYSDKSRENQIGNPRSNLIEQHHSQSIHKNSHNNNNIIVPHVDKHASTKSMILSPTDKIDSTQLQDNLSHDLEQLQSVVDNLANSPLFSPYKNQIEQNDTNTLKKDELQISHLSESPSNKSPSSNSSINSNPTQENSHGIGEDVDEEEGISSDASSGRGKTIVSSNDDSSEDKMVDASPNNFSVSPNIIVKKKIPNSISLYSPPSSNLNDQNLCDSFHLITTSQTTENFNSPNPLMTRSVQETSQNKKNKTDEIKFALKKMQEAYVKRIPIKIISNDKIFQTIVPDESLSCGKILLHILHKQNLRFSIDYSLVELLPDLAMERHFEDNESIISAIYCWPRDSKNQIHLKKNPQKYRMFQEPEKYLIGKDAQEGIGNAWSTSRRQSLMREFFPDYKFDDNNSALFSDLTQNNCQKNSIPLNTSMWTLSQQLMSKNVMKNANHLANLPNIQGYLYFKVQSRKMWRKHFCVLRSSGLYYVRKNRSSTNYRNSLVKSNDLQPILDFSNNEIYYGIDWKRKFKAPTNYCFGMKSVQVQKKSSTYIKYFCAENQQQFDLWVCGIRLAKFGYRLRQNYDEVSYVYDKCQENDGYITRGNFQIIDQLDNRFDYNEKTTLTGISFNVNNEGRLKSDIDHIIDDHSKVQLLTISSTTTTNVPNDTTSTTSENMSLKERLEDHKKIWQNCQSNLVIAERPMRKRNDLSPQSVMTMCGSCDDIDMEYNKSKTDLSLITTDSDERIQNKDNATHRHINKESLEQRFNKYTASFSGMEFTQPPQISPRDLVATNCSSLTRDDQTPTNYHNIINETNEDDENNEQLIGVQFDYLTANKYKENSFYGSFPMNEDDNKLNVVPPPTLLIDEINNSSFGCQYQTHSTKMHTPPPPPPPPRQPLR
ncbi:hypothetical protein SNEBB_011142 [Seison nebaliae]|nr:hypothetical protein SNEBB_011142 [Seison nebaliae]